MPSSSHDEYTDYSCSTPVERLARDVESVLRSWHLFGSDRHVSFAQKSPLHRNTTGSHTNDDEQQQAQRDSFQNNRSAFDSLNDNAAVPAQTASRKKSSLTSQVQVIRTHEIAWTVTLSNGSKEPITLNLDLWDGPSLDDQRPSLPLSLQRVPITAMPQDLFLNLSTVFGIGQHLTLSLKSGDSTANTTTSNHSDIVWALGQSVIQRHDDKVAPWVVTSALSGMLQTALQLSLSNIQCNLPAFGIWGSYCPSSSSSSQSPSLLPQWMEQSLKLPTGRIRLFSNRAKKNKVHIPPILKSTMCCLHDDDTYFWMSVMPNDKVQSLSAWGDLLLQHTDSETVVLCGAKHLYAWRKAHMRMPRTRMIFGNNKIGEWRQRHEQAKEDDKIHDDATPMTVQEYQEACRRYAIRLIVRFSGASDVEPLWGPVDDPIDQVNVTVTWDPSKEGSLLTMPLKVRSQQGMTPRDYAELEEGVERSILNPLNNPSNFLVSTVYDSETSLVHLAATQRLLLAAMIRTTILPASTMMHQLTDEFEMEEFISDEAGALTEAILNRAGVGAITRQLVHAIDWNTLSEEMVEGREAEKVVDRVMDGSLTLGFPTIDDDDAEEGYTGDPLFAPLPKSAPAGRLLSILFVHMSRLRSPASMAMVWTYFVHDLQKRFYARQSLPNMGYIPGLDPAQGEMDEKKCFSTSGMRVRAENAAYVHCTEPQPDDMHCLIGQKLQAFNIGIESIVATDMYNSTKLGREFDQDEEEERQAGGGAVDKVPGRSESQEDDQFEFYDAQSVGSEDGLAMQEHNANLFEGGVDPNEALERQGARCPVFGVNLIQTGDQLYAPYLRRSHPWTDDVILDRRRIFLQNARQSSVLERFEMAHRFIKPKLLSDMRAFKAANPGASFEDFTNWYGDPGNTLEEFDRTGVDDDINSLDNEKLGETNKADEEGRNCTDSFWKATWAESSPMPAIDQPPLFNVVSTVEIILDHLDTIHPASLLNQVMAVNLSMSYFSLVSTAGNAALSIPAVKTSFEHLRTKVEVALKILSRDATHGTSALTSKSAEHLPRHASLQSIRACEDACNAISDSEALLARVTSLLHKFPGQQYDFIAAILRNNKNPGDFIPFESETGRSALLGVIRQQQQHRDTLLPRPSRRSYILRNTDDEAPCQMCVRYGEDDTFEEKEGGLLIAITKTASDR